jgi:hypothetical protein
MERVHQLVAIGNIDAETEHFWSHNWRHIASAKVPLETKVTVYNALKRRYHANVDVNNFYVVGLYRMARADRHFVAALDLDVYTTHCYRLAIIWIDDDVAELTAYYQRIAEDPTPLRIKLDLSEDEYSEMIHHVLMDANPPRCLRFLLQGKAFREMMMRDRMSPLAQRLAEELVQPTDQLDSYQLLKYGQSVKLIEMCVQDEELVATWLQAVRNYTLEYPGCMLVPFARKLHALITPEQRGDVKTKVLWSIAHGVSNDGGFELAWLLGLLGPFNPTVQGHFRRGNVNLFPALTFAMIVAMCDGYLEMARGVTKSQKRFFALVTRLPMDLQALVSLRLYGQAATVIQGDKFNRAFLAII